MRAKDQQVGLLDQVKGKESGTALIRRVNSVPPGRALVTPVPVSSHLLTCCVLRSREMTNIKGTSQTQRMRWIPTLTLMKGMNHPAMEKWKSPEGSAEWLPKPIRCRGTPGFLDSYAPFCRGPHIPSFQSHGCNASFFSLRPSSVFCRSLLFSGVWSHSICRSLSRA